MSSRNYVLLLLPLVFTVACNQFLDPAPNGFEDASAHPNFNAAVEAALHHGLSGVYIPSGYTSDATGGLSLPSNFAVLGKDLTSRLNFTSLSSGNGFVVNGASGVSFKNFSISTSAKGQIISLCGLIYGDGASGITVSGVTFIGAPCMGVALLRATRSLITGNITTDGKFIQIRVDGANNTITKNTVNGGQWYGISVSGSDNLVASNTIIGLKGAASFGINFTLSKNTVIRDNRIQYVEHYGMYAEICGANIISGNLITGIGHAPNGALLDEAGTGISISPGCDGNLFVGNTISGLDGYDIVLSGGLTLASSASDSKNNVISGNTLQTSGDPSITINGASSVTIRKNQISSTGSVGINLGDEHDAPSLRYGISPNAKVLNNSITAQYEGIYLTGTSNSTLMGNVISNSGTVTDTSASHHVPAGLNLVNWSPLNGGNHNNILIGNSITSGLASSNYGIYMDAGQSSNTFAYNVLYPNRVPFQNNSGNSTNFFQGNVTWSVMTSLNAAPPIADAGLGGISAPGAKVDLDGSGSFRMLGSERFSYAWQQFKGPSVVLSDASDAKPTFVAPSTTQATILGFRLTVSDSNGATSDDVYVAVDPSLSER